MRGFSFQTMPVRAALLAYFELEDLPRLLQALGGSGMPAETRVHVGSFGVSQDASEQIRAQASRRYSPMFKTQRTAAWEGRRLTAREEQLVGPRFRGPVPPESRILQLSAAQRTGWGIEIGRRYRDSMRAARRSGVRIDSWQLDELATQLAGAQGRQHREFVRGILQGLTFGRRILGDREGKGFVWATRRALRLASLPVTAELTAFWRQLDRACFR